MKNLIFILFAILSMTTWSQEIETDNYIYQHPNPKANFPQPIGLLNDYVNILKPEDQKEIAEKLKEYENKSGHKIYVVIVRNIDPYTDIVNYSNDLSNYWKIFRENEANEFMICMGMGIKDLRIKATATYLDKMSFEFLDDLINKILIPNFNQAKFFEGINECIDEVIAAWGYND